MTQDTLFTKMKEDAVLVNTALSELMTDGEEATISGLLDAEKYSLLAGGKRIRPMLVLAFCRMFGGSDDAALPYACALEMIHTASLIHDDLPCIDNDDLRRGRPTNHVIYGESTALLAGDGLLMDAFGIVAKNGLVAPELTVEAITVLSRETGTRGLVGGEFIDILGETKSFDLNTLKDMHYRKTGALIRASAVLGCIAAGMNTRDERMKDVLTYADSIGLAFQIIDDILDATGTKELLGKTPGKDAQENKTTYLSFYTVEEAYALAKDLTRLATSAVEKYESSEFLVALAEYLCARNQ